MPISRECVVSAGPGVQIGCTPAPDGSIIIQTRDGPINILFLHAANAGNSQSNGASQRTPWSLFESSITERSGSRFCFACSRAATGDNEDGVGEEDEVDNTESMEDIIANDDDHDDNIEADGTEHDDVEGGSRDDTEAIKLEVTQQCQSIKANIEKKREADLILKQSLSNWAANEYSFFGRSQCDSSAEWSYHCLNESEKGIHLYRNPIHKWNLAKCCREREQILATDPDLTSRQAMLRELEPRLDNLSRKEKQKIYKRFERYINQGDVLMLMEDRYPGLLLTIARYLTVRQYVTSYLIHILHTNGLRFDFLWQYKDVPHVCGFSWLGVEILEEAVEYAELAGKILNLTRARAGRSIVYHR